MAFTVQTRDAARALGAQVSAARKSQRMTAAALAARAGINVRTLRKVEQGDPTVTLGVAFDCAAILGVPLFTPNPAELAILSHNLADRAALLGTRVVPITDEGLDDDF